MEEQDRLEPEASLRNPEEDSLSAEARRIQAGSLEDLKLQISRSTFDTWLRGSQVSKLAMDA